MKWLENIGFIKGSSVAGVHLVIRLNGSWHMDISILKKKNNKISIARSFSGLELPDKITSIIPQNTPICLSLEGKGVIHRKISLEDGIDPVTQILPNAKPSDFIIQSQVIDSRQSFISLVRFESLNEVLQFFKEKGYYICRLYLGPFSLNNIWPLVINHEDLSFVKGYKITQNNELITELEFTEEDLNTDKLSIQEERIDSNLIIPYANALSYYIKGNTNLLIQRSSHPVIRYEEFLYRRAFQFSAIGLAVMIFIILVINFLLFTHYNEKLSKVSTEYRSGLELIGRMEKLKSEVNLREMLISESGILADSRFSYYADRIAALLPRQIVLTRLEINPLLAKPKQEKELVFTKNTIRISGKCPYSSVLNDWMEVLKSEKWISHIDILQYKQEEKGMPGEFILKLEIQ